MTGLVPYLLLDGRAAEALAFYREVFGGELVIHTFDQFGRADGPATHVAHGVLQGPVSLFAADVPAGEPALAMTGVMFSLLGTAAPAELERWFAALAETGEVIDELALKPWGDHDGQVRDRFGVTWLIGYQG